MAKATTLAWSSPPRRPSKLLPILLSQTSNLEDLLVCCLIRVNPRAKHK